MSLRRRWFGFSLRHPGGMLLIGSRRLSWFPSSLQRGAGELDSFRLSRERVQPALDGRHDSLMSNVKGLYLFPNFFFHSIPHRLFAALNFQNGLLRFETASLGYRATQKSAYRHRNRIVFCVLEGKPRS